MLTAIELMNGDTFTSRRDKRRVCCCDELDVWKARCQEAHNVTLPARVQVLLNLID